MAESRFERCLAEVLAREGGYVDNPADPGGATNMGITHKTLARWRRVSPWWDLPKSAVRALEREEAACIYRALYWDICRGDALPAGIDLATFDFAVNSGPERALRTLQAVLGVAVDAIVGPETLASAGRMLGMALAPVVSALDLAEVLLSGPPELLDGPLREAALTAVRTRTMPVIGRGLSVRMGSLDEDGALAGAAVLVLSGQLGVT